MQSSDIPAKFPIPFANGAGGAYVRAVPTASQIGVHDGWASLTDGFPPLNFNPVASGGIPPFGQDMNGLLKQDTAWARWQAAGAPVAYDASFSSAIGGYPKGAVVNSATTFGLVWMSTAENNTTNPDSGGAGWVAFSAAARAKTITIATTQTYTPTVGLIFCLVRGIAGGGGGGGAFGATSPNVSAATGGASGAYFERLYSAAEVGASAAVIIGAAGAGGAAGQNNGTSGGGTSFTPAGTGTTLVAAGGGGGPFGITATIPNRGGFLAGSGNATGGDLNIAGQPGSIPLLFGGSAAYTAVSGNGGNSFWAAGGQSSQENAAGNIAKGYGAGGGGGAALTASTPGGAGYQGLVLITEYLRAA